MVRQVKFGKAHTLTLHFLKESLFAAGPGRVASRAVWAAVTFCAAARSGSSLYLKGVAKLNIYQRIGNASSLRWQELTSRTRRPLHLHGNEDKKLG